MFGILTYSYNTNVYYIDYSKGCSTSFITDELGLNEDKMADFLMALNKRNQENEPFYDN